MRRGTMGVQIGSKHTLKDWNLGWTTVNLGFPEAKTYEQDIPGADGTLDLTEVMTGGDVKYKNRTLSLEFEVEDEDFCRWSVIVSEIANYLAGQRMKIILDNDLYFYYVGRLALDVEKTEKSESKLVISGEVEPYKYERYSSLEEWIWDTFNFEVGVIRAYKNIRVENSYELLIPGLRKRIVPIIECSVSMRVSYNGKTYELRAGKNKVFDIWLGEGENILIFTGTGNVSVEYRGGSL
ncbi:hypothetical protein C818_04232 [Lachnospiraceae bacterium MD308]|nr:hypothetical protein C818_04232 [Lachnospiraceae bacterium MD308]